MKENINGIQLDKKDNVAVALETLKTGEQLIIKDMEKIKVNKTIPYGHKIALARIPKDHEIIKYGECMGIATKDIAIGDHVHVSNVRGLTEKDKDSEKGEIRFENI
jgi:ribosomal protein L2